MRVLPALVATGALVVGALVATPATTTGAERPREPRKVHKVTVVRAGPHSLTLRWQKARHAQRYVIERAGGIKKPPQKVVRVTSGRTVTVKHLRQGRLYCFWVRGKNRDRLGDRSYRACQYTIAKQGAKKGPRYDVMTWNLCTRACGRWNKRKGAAARLIRQRSPSVLMLQEYPEGLGLMKQLRGYAKAEGHAAKALLYKKKRFKIARKHGKRRAGVIALGYDPQADKTRWAVWAELVDKSARGKHVIFVSAHLSPGPDTKRSSKIRAANAERLVRGVRKVNGRHRPVVIGGDFNSTQANRWNGGAKRMKHAGYRNSFFYAQRWHRPNLNSYTQKRAKPTWGTIWGRHVDQVWMRAGQVRVLKWSNAGRLVRGRYPTPLVSDHNPVLVKLRVN